VILIGEIVEWDVVFLGSSGSLVGLSRWPSSECGVTELANRN
jgi:hypothetical protein